MKCQLSNTIYGLKFTMEKNDFERLKPFTQYLFRSWQNSMNGKICNDDEAVKSHLVQFFPIKTRSSMSVESRSYQKDSKRSLHKIENISLIKIHSLH